MFFVNCIIYISNFTKKVKIKKLLYSWFLVFPWILFIYGYFIISFFIFYIFKMPQELVAWFDWSYLNALWMDTHTMTVSWSIWLVFTLICLWRVFNKAWRAGWKAIIPFYNVYTWFKIAWRSWWWVLSLIFPPLFAIMMIISYFDVSKRFWKWWLFALGLLFFNPIFLAILAFTHVKYTAKN